MANQTKEPPIVPLNAKAYEQMKANAPSFSQSMLNVTAHMGTKSTPKPISESLVRIKTVIHTL